MIAPERVNAAAALVIGLVAGGLAGADPRAGRPLGIAGLAALALGAAVGRRAGSALAMASSERDTVACGTEACGGARLTVLVPARNEAGVLPDLIRDLAGQSHRGPDGCRGSDVVVIDDDSTDGTGTVATRTAVALGLGDHLRVDRTAAGSKGSALASARVDDPCSTIVVLDADARVPDGFVCAVSRLAGQVPAATLRRRTLHGDGDAWGSVQDDEQTIDGALQALRMRAGGAPEFRGNGMVIHRDTLEAAGGWPTGELTEDLALSTRLLVRGQRIAWDGGVAVWEEAVDGLAPFARQRSRWAEGSLRRLLAVRPVDIVKAPIPTPARIDLVVSYAQAVGPPALVGLLAGSLATGHMRRVVLTVAGLAATTSLVVHPVLVAAEADDATAVGSGSRWRPSAARARRTARLTAYLSHWIPALLAALARIALWPSGGRYRPTPHVRRAAPPWERVRATEPGARPVAQPGIDRHREYASRSVAAADAGRGPDRTRGATVTGEAMT